MIVVGTTLAAYVMDRPETWGAWTAWADRLRESHPSGVRYFAALELDARGIEPFRGLIHRLRELDGEYWTFSLDDGRTEVTTANRLRHITTGQNLVTDYACSQPNVTHLLFMAADCEPPPDILPKLLELDHPIVGAECRTYCLTGPLVPGYPFEVQAHMATAACILLRRDLFRRLRWRWDVDAGETDDPCMYRDARELLGYETFVRKDCIARHHPEAIPGIEHRGHDRRVFRVEM